MFKRHTEQEFGGQLPFQADYRSDYVQKLIKKDGGWMLFPPIPFSDDTPNYDLNKPAPSPPTNVNWLGTDDQARDVLARVIFGARVSILFALMLTFVSALIGIAAGALQGYYGGWVDLLGQRLLEVWSGLPVLYLLIILSGFVEPNFWWLLGIMALFSWLALVDVVRAEFLRGRNLEYVKAARALGLTRSQSDRAAHPAQRDERDPELPAVHSDRGDFHPDGAGFPRFRHAGRQRLAGRTDRSGQAEPASAVAGADGVFHPGADSFFTGVYRRSVA